MWGERGETLAFDVINLCDLVRTCATINHQATGTHFSTPVTSPQKKLQLICVFRFSSRKFRRLLGTPQPRTLYFLVEAKSRVREVYAQTCLHFSKQGMLDTELFGLAVLIGKSGT